MPLLIIAFDIMHPCVLTIIPFANLHAVVAAYQNDVNLV